MESQTAHTIQPIWQLVRAIDSAGRDERRRRRRQHEQLVEQSEEPEESVELSGAKPRSKRKTSLRCLLAAASSVVDLSPLLRKRPASFEEQMATVIFTPGRAVSFLTATLR